MTVSARTAKTLCTKSEYELVRESSARQVTRLDQKKLNSRIARSRKLRDKYRSLASRQQREARGKQPPKGRRGSQGSRQTSTKEQLFLETLERFQAQLKKLTGKNGASSKASKSVTREKSSAPKKKTATGKKKSTRKTAKKKTATKKNPSTRKKSPAKKKTPSRRLTPPKPAKKKNPKRKTKTPTSAKKAQAAAKNAKIKQSGRVRKTAHVSSRSRRSQGRRDISR